MESLLSPTSNGPRQHGKDDERSVECRNRGNQHFVRKQLDAALDCYTQAITWATPGSVCLALGYSNRSAVLLELGHRAHCAADVQRAIELISTERLDIADKTQHKLAARLTQATTDCNSSRSEPEPLKEQQPLPPLYRTQQSEHVNGHSSSALPLAALSNAVELRHSPHRGRHLVARSHIPAGSVVVCESPYTSVVLQHSAQSHCAHCCRPLLPHLHLPCHNCADPSVRYCDDQCRSLDWSSYHWLECGQVQRLLDLGISHLALRLLLATRPECFKSWSVQSARPLEGRYGTQACELECSDEEERAFLWVASLETHDDRLSAQDRRMYSSAADGLVKLLKARGYFDELRGSSSNSSLSSLCNMSTLLPGLARPDFYIDRIKNWLFGLIARCICNGHAIVDIENTPHSNTHIDAQTEQRVATGIYPCTSMLNHSCAPTCISSFVNGNAVVVRTTRPLQPGDELTNCYGPEMGRMVRADRQQALLQQYRFRCACVACTQPQYEAVERHMEASVCLACSHALVVSGECGGCGQRPNAGHNRRLQLLTNKVNRFVDEYEPSQRRQLDTAVQLLAECDRLLHKHHRSYVRLRDATAACHSCQGEHSQAAALIARNLDALTEWHGVGSLPVAREQAKLADLYSLAAQPDKAAPLQRQADRTHIVHFGLQHVLRGRQRNGN